MNTAEKVKILGEAGRYDSCGPKSCEVRVKKGLGGVYVAKAERNDCRIFKTLMKNTCTHDCGYCANSASCKKGGKKAEYKPRELADVFSYMRKKMQVDGLFLSSAVTGDPDKVTEDMVEALEIIRNERRFRGYVHFKVLPGTSRHLIDQAAVLSSRMSINIEAPNGSVMGEMSTTKDFRTDILKRQRWISRLKLPGGQSTQVILNRLSTDREVLRMASWEYREMDLRRVYYSGFKPVSGTPLGKEREEPQSRQNRLYNADFLLRDYGYAPKEIFSIMDDGMLPFGDPKMEIAKASFDGPLDINEASYEELIRVPGIGPRTARKILDNGNVQKLGDLHRLGGWTKRAEPFIKINGRHQSMLCDFR